MHPTTRGETSKKSTSARSNLNYSTTQRLSPPRDFDSSQVASADSVIQVQAYTESFLTASYKAGLSFPLTPKEIDYSMKKRSQVRQIMIFRARCPSHNTPNADEDLTCPHDRRGLLSMVSFGKDTNSSQFFITLGSLPWLNGLQVVFGMYLVKLSVHSIFHLHF